MKNKNMGRQITPDTLATFECREATAARFCSRHIPTVKTWRRRGLLGDNSSSRYSLSRLVRLWMVSQFNTGLHRVTGAAEIAAFAHNEVTALLLTRPKNAPNKFATIYPRGMFVFDGKNQFENHVRVIAADHNCCWFHCINLTNNADRFSEQFLDFFADGQP